MTQITEQLVRLQRRVETAAKCTNRDPGSIRILAVSKKQPIDALKEAYAAGLRDFGENYLQEGLDKIPALAADAVWHFIGLVQSNKTRPIAENFDWVHTVTSRRIAARLSEQRPGECDDLQVCIQLRPNGARNRNGVAEEELADLVKFIESASKLCLRGLMIMPLPGRGTTYMRSEFARARRLYDELRCTTHTVDTLSMGMSADLEEAIMEGSTCIRIGTDLFGKRNYE